MAKTEATAVGHSTPKAVTGKSVPAESDASILAKNPSVDSLESLASTTSPAPSPTLQARANTSNPIDGLGAPAVLVNEDIGAARNEWLFNPPSVVVEGIKSLLIDERDLPMALAFFNICVTTLPAAAAVFYFRSHVFGLVYIVTNLLLYQERFILALHFSSHRSIFKSSVLNLVPPYLLSPFFGIPSGIYYLHHCVMHHVENNVFPYDVSSTEPYQRDNFAHLIVYWLRFLLAIWVELPYYALRRQRYGLAFHSVTCIGFFFVVTTILYSVNPVGTLWIFWIYTLVNSFLLMLGNWSQHIFVSPRNPDSNYLLAYNLINVSSNQRCFNDGYHVEHHLHSRRHWSELPSSFMRSLDKYAKEDGLVFRGIDNMAVGFLTFTGQLDKLAEHYVQLGPVERTKEEIVAELKHRLVPIHRKPKSS